MSTESRKQEPRKKRGSARNVSRFPLDQGMTQPNRVAHFLDWWAKENPFDYVAYNELLKAVQGYAHLPRITTEEVLLLRNRIHSSEKILTEKYGRFIIRARGLGIRASVDDEDVLRNKQTGALTRAHGAIKRAVEVDKHINLSKVPEGPLKKWYSKGGVRGILNQVGSEAELQKLLPPKPEDDTNG